MMRRAATALVEAGRRRAFALLLQAPVLAPGADREDDQDRIAPEAQRRGISDRQEVGLEGLTRWPKLVVSWSPLTHNGQNRSE